MIEVVNHYLNEMTEAIMAAGGTLIAYMGDGIMAVFGAPLEQDDHADRALRAAREMLGPRLDRFNEWLAEQGHDHRFAMGVGLNSGPVMAGNVGSEQRVEYTAIGDTTNTASRLESMTKGCGTMLFVSQTHARTDAGPARGSGAGGRARGARARGEAPGVDARRSGLSRAKPTLVRDAYLVVRRPLSSVRSAAAARTAAAVTRWRSGSSRARRTAVAAVAIVRRRSGWSS